MNKFDSIFFDKYLSWDDEVLLVCHKHPILIVDTAIVWIFFGLLVPLFFYYNSYSIGNILFPVWWIEIYFFGVYSMLLYQIFDWYSDAWILTKRGIIDLDWSLFRRDISYIEFRDIKGVGLEQNDWTDTFFDKGDVTLFLPGDDDGFVLEWAQNPTEINGIIQDILDGIESSKKQVKKQEYELVLDALKSVVRQHIQELENHSEEEDEEAEAEEEIEENTEPEYIAEALEKKGTLDLRDAIVNLDKKKN